MTNVCPQCGQQHFPLSVYRDWIKRYQQNKLSGRMRVGLSEQIARWQQLIAEHESDKPIVSAQSPKGQKRKSRG